eukprot:TRINITY_DN21716_c0_g1_i1.p1 TRINITY_DN21716_c0_g1~~TRINITY_DN21716_c0_g1_i1.p1  ORF type:complete len:140 (+),score=52.40 TRINITY_DN21716_c0_g1_i1:93-512(+)
MAPTNARYCKAYRKKSKSFTPPEVMQFKNKIINSKKKANELTRRLNDKAYDDKILQKNRDRDKRLRDKKKAEAKNSSYEGPTLSDDILSQEDTNKKRPAKNLQPRKYQARRSNQEGPTTTAPQLEPQECYRKGRRRITG